MRLRLLPPLAAICIVDSAAGAQRDVAVAGVTRQAFTRAIVPAIGLASFGPRLDEAGGGNFRYQSSLALALEGEAPISRRTGLLANVSVAPLSGQEEHRDQNSASTFARFAVFSLDAGVAARFKPSAPVFLYLGGGADFASRHAAPIAGGGGAVEPYGTVALGYDQLRHDRWNVRILLCDRAVHPHDPQSAGLTARRRANDWSVLVGARYSFLRVAPRPGTSPT